LPKFFLRRDVVFLIHSDIPDDLAAQQPEIVHVLSDGLPGQPIVNQVQHKRPHHRQQTLPIWNVFLNARPSFRPLGKIGADIFGCFHIFSQFMIFWGLLSSYLAPSYNPICCLGPPPSPTTQS
jgi:hypothetical protein